MGERASLDLFFLHGKMGVGFGGYLGEVGDADHLSFLPSSASLSPMMVAVFPPTLASISSKMSVGVWFLSAEAILRARKRRESSPPLECSLTRAGCSPGLALSQKMDLIVALARSCLWPQLNVHFCFGHIEGLELGG